jgi:hypothetical protein
MNDIGRDILQEIHGIEFRRGEGMVSNNEADALSRLEDFDFDGRIGQQVRHFHESKSPRTNLESLSLPRFRSGDPI